MKKWVVVLGLVSASAQIITPGPGGGGGSSTLGIVQTPYTQNVVNLASATIAATTHHFGTVPFAWCVDSNGVNTQCQVQVNGSGDLTVTFVPNFTGKVNVISGGTVTNSIQSGTSDPATCAPAGPGNIYFNTNQSNLKLCNGTNTWVGLLHDSINVSNAGLITLRDITSVKDNGALGNGIQTTCAIVASNTTATCSGATFVNATQPAGEVGKTIIFANYDGLAHVFSTTIASVTDATHVVLTAAPTSSNAATTTYYGTLDEAAIQAIISAGKTPFLPCATYITTSMFKYNVMSAGQCVHIVSTNSAFAADAGLLVGQYGPDNNMFPTTSMMNMDDPIDSNTNTNTKLSWTFNNTHVWNATLPNVFGLSLIMNELQGGKNFYATDKSNYAPLNIFVNRYTASQSEAMTIYQNNYSVGDSLTWAVRHKCYGGATAGSDEGCAILDYYMFEGNLQYAGTMVGSTAAGATAVTITPGALGNPDRPGEGRYLLNLTAGVTGGSVTAATFSGSALQQFTVSPNVTASVAYGTLSTAITSPGSRTVTLAATVGTVSTNITTSTPVTFGGPDTPETVIPTAVSGTTITAVFKRPHASGSNWGVGGYAGWQCDLLADRVDNTTYTAGGILQTILGTTLRYPHQIIYSTANTLFVYSGGNGGYTTLANITKWSSGGTSGYSAYPSAEIAQVGVNTTTGAYDNTLVLAPNPVTFNNGDSYDIPAYQTTHMTGGHIDFEQYRLPYTVTSAMPYVQWSGIASSLNYGLYFNNTVDPNLYSQSTSPPQGKFNAPWIARLTGEYSYGLYFDANPDFGAVSTGCGYVTGTQTCTNTGVFLQALGSSLGGGTADTFSYNRNSTNWELTAHNRGGTHVWGSSGYISSGYVRGSSFLSTIGGSGTTGTVTLTAAASTFFSYVLTGNVTGQTYSNTNAVGQEITILIQPNGFTWAWGTNFVGGGTVSGTGATICLQNFAYTTIDSKFHSSSPMQCN